MLKKYALFPCVTILILIVILILCECQVGMGKKKKRNVKVNIVSILDHRIQKIMKFCQRLVKDDGNLFDGIQLLQTVYDQINLPYFDQLKLKHRYALQKRLNEYKYQNKSFYILMKQTENTFQLSRKIIQLHFQLLIALHSAGDITNSKIYLLKIYDGIMKLKPSKRKGRKQMTEIFPAQFIYLTVEILFQYRFFQRVINIYNNTLHVYRKQLWSNNDVLKRYLLMSKEKLKLLHNTEQIDNNIKNDNIIQLKYRELIESSSCKKEKHSNSNCGYITSPIAPESRRLIFEDKRTYSEYSEQKFNPILHKMFPKLDFNRNDIDILNFDQVDLASPNNIFINKYVNKGRPVLLRGFVNGSSFKISKFLKKYGKTRISVSNSKDVVARQWIEDCRTINCRQLSKYNALFFQRLMSINNFVSNITKGAYISGKNFKIGRIKNGYDRNQTTAAWTLPYFFGPLKMKNNEYADILKKLKKLFPLKHFAKKKTKAGKDKDIFFIGSIGSGTYFHSHAAAANVLFLGRKKWLLLPPMTYAGPGSASMQWWVEHLYNKLPIKAIEVVQEENDLLYIPPYFKHATINIDKMVVGVAFQHIGEHKIDFKTYDFSIHHGNSQDVVELNQQNVGGSSSEKSRTEL